MSGLKVKIISAGAGSGKTYRLTSELVAFLKDGKVRPSGIIATTFTNKAAAELQERVRKALIEEGLSDKANELGHAMIGTVHSLGVKLLSRFAMEAGISPQVDIIADEDKDLFFSQSMAMVLTPERVSSIEQLAARLGMGASENRFADWRSLLKELTEVARSNDFDEQCLMESKDISIQEFFKFLKADENDRQYQGLAADDWNSRLGELLSQTIDQLIQNEDSTKKTQAVVDDLKKIKFKFDRGETLDWSDWARLSKIQVGVKSKSDVEHLIEFTRAHYLHPDFQEDLQNFISELFELSIAAITEYTNFKKQRGLIDYTDMEVLVRHILERPDVQEILSEELDLLMVDEFQDTNPLQLDIFMKLSSLAKHSVWVGDPKQSIYGFRGAEPALIQAIIENQGGLDLANIQPYSWRSREGLVDFSNAVFTRSFEHIPSEQIALKAQRKQESEPPQLVAPVIEWNFSPNDPSYRIKNEWMFNAMATGIKELLSDEFLVQPKGDKSWRRVLPGDIAVLCRSNFGCQQMATALNKAGVKASVASAGLLETAEAKLITACLRLILNRYDSLSKAEVWYLTSDHNIEAIVNNRLDFLEQKDNGVSEANWALEVEAIGRLDKLRPQLGELSASEILQLIVDELDLRRLVIQWGNADQRISNLEMLLKLSQDYEDACNRRNSASSTGGFLLWLNELSAGEKDYQGAFEDPQAVKVLTYHKSKGLEYPVVICNNLWQSLREDIWGISLVRKNENIDLNNPLGDRWLRLWVNPYGQQFQRTVLAERLSESIEQKLQTKAAIEEEKRLLYVGFTRARDYLILPTAARFEPKWLNRALNLDPGFKNACDLLVEGDLSWNGKPICFLRKQIEREVEFPEISFENEFEAFYFESPCGSLVHQNLLMDYSELKFRFKVASIKNYAPSLFLGEGTDDQVILQLFRSLKPDYGDGLVGQLVTDLFRRVPQLKEVLSSDEISIRIQAYLNALQELGEGRWHFLQPFSGNVDGQRFEIELDVLIENDATLQIIQNSHLREEAIYEGRAIKVEAAKLLVSKLAASTLFSPSNCICYLNLPFSGKMICIEFLDHSSS